MKLDRTTARRFCEQYQLPTAPNDDPARPDFYALDYATVMRVEALADLLSYRQPKNASASRVCYFYGKLGRALAKI